MRVDDLDELCLRAVSSGENRTLLTRARKSGAKLYRTRGNHCVVVAPDGAQLVVGVTTTNFHATKKLKIFLRRHALLA